MIGGISFTEAISRDEPIHYKIPSSHSEIINDYVHHMTSKRLDILIPVFIICILIGLKGNLLFIYLFGRKAEKVFESRDALYFRWMASCDLLVCGFVLPYVICYEAGIVTSDYACRGLEFIRHMILYCSHLSLTTYSMEFARRINYNEAEVFIAKSTRIILVVALIHSIPVVFIFEAGEVFKNNLIIKNSTSPVQTLMNDPESSLATDHNNESDSFLEETVLFSCHLSFNFNPKYKYYHHIETIQILYFITNALMYLLHLLLFILKILRYLDARPYLGRDSMFIHVIEAKDPLIKERVSIYTAKLSEDGHKLRGVHLVSREAGSATSLSLEDLPVGQAKSGRGLSDEGLAETGKRISETCRRFSQVEIRRDVMGSKPSLHKKVAWADKDRSDHDLTAMTNQFSDTMGWRVLTRTQSSRVDPPQKESFMGDIKNEAGRRPSAVHFNKYISSPATTVSDLESEGPRQLTIYQYLLRIFCAKLMGIPAENGEFGKPVLMQTFYTKSLMFLVFMDLIIFSICIIVYEATARNSTILNFIHIKSVFGFYIISVLNPELRRVMWGQCCLLCNFVCPDSSYKIKVLTAESSHHDILRRVSRDGLDENKIGQPLVEPTIFQLKTPASRMKSTSSLSAQRPVLGSRSEDSLIVQKY